MSVKFTAGLKRTLFPVHFYDYIFVGKMKANIFFIQVSLLHICGYFIWFDTVKGWKRNFDFFFIFFYEKWFIHLYNSAPTS